MPGELYLSRRGAQVWAALRESGRSVELYAEPVKTTSQLGRIVKARVAAVLPGIQSAFVDLGAERTAFLHASDVRLPGEAPAPGLPAEPVERRSSRRAAGGPPIEERLAEGHEVLVQVTRESLGTKGARVSSYLTLPGRHLVLFPQAALRSVSRRIEEPDERERLAAILAGLPGPPVGFVARTAAAGIDARRLEREALALLEVWEGIDRDAAAGGPVPRTVHRDLDPALRLIRDAPATLERIVVDDPADRRDALQYLERFDPELATKVELHPGPTPLFEAYGLNDDIDRALRPRVWLKSGGYLVIEETEALVSIDVNTGKFVGRRAPEETILRTNLEAAAEIPRQLRLRGLGGIIVVDLIDMAGREDQRQVVDALQAALLKDRARTKVVGLSDIGLLQLTRKRARAGLSARLLRDCPSCSGRGRIRRDEPA